MWCDPIAYKKKKDRYTQGFEIDLCEKCPLVSDCAVKRKARFFCLNYTERNLRIAKRRQYERSEEFRQKYRWRAGVEATMSQYDRLTGVKRLRVRGRKAVHYAAVMKATALNIMRAVAARQARMRASGAETDRNQGDCRVFRLFKERIGSIFRSMARWAARKLAFRAYAHNAV